MKIISAALAAIGSVFTTIPASAAEPAIRDFVGNWIYEQPDGARHVANVTFTVKGSAAEGEWGDGSARGSGASGRLKGVMQHGELAVRFCIDDGSMNYPACPDYETSASSVFKLSGGKLVWFKISGRNAGRYVALTRQP